VPPKASSNGYAAAGGNVSTEAAAKKGDISGLKLPQLTPKQKRQLLGTEIGTQFDFYTRLFAAFTGGDVFEIGEWRARDIDEMLRRDGDAQSCSEALILPLVSTTYTIDGVKGDTGEAELANEQLMSPPGANGTDPGFDQVIALMAQACIYRKTFFEKKWDLEGGPNKVKLTKLAWRPASTCDVKRNERTADFDGFRQRAWWFGTSPQKQNAAPGGSNFTGYLDIPAMRSFVYIHGQYRNPLIGASDMDVVYWAYKQKLKILFLWFQFLELMATPRIAAYGPDQPSADAIASTIAQMKGSGVGGFIRPPAGQKLFDVISSGVSGGAEYKDAIDFLASYQTQSVLAGFLRLPAAAALGRGSYALSESQSQFFLQARTATVREMCASYTRNVIAPLIVLNRGADARVPQLHASPLTQGDTQQIVTAFTQMAVAPQLKVADEYVDLLAVKTGQVLDLPTAQVQDVIAKGAKMRAALAAELSRQGAQPAAQGAAKIAGATQAASGLAGKQLQAQQGGNQ